MTQEIPLTGKWLFIGAEKHTGSAWKPSTLVKNMTWEFIPQYFSKTQSIGNIVESSQYAPPIKMEYAYNNSDKLLKISIFLDSTIGVDDKSEVDYYDVEFCEDESVERPTIKISILTQEGVPLPYLRYILQRIDPLI